MVALIAYWEEAEKSWDTARLYKDLSQTKGRELTELQKAKLRGALCSVSLKDVATKLNRGLKGLRTDLSQGLYRFIEMLLADKEILHGGISWQQIPWLLTAAGYRRLSLASTYEALEEITVPYLNEDSIRASEIIAAFERNRIHNPNPKLHSEVAKKLAQEGKSAKLNQDYAKAIRFYRVLVEQDASCNNFFVCIATCFDQLNQRTDAVAIALKALSLISDKNRIATLNGVLGSAYHELAIHTLDEFVLNLALFHYNKARFTSDFIDVVGAWNSFDILLKFSLLAKFNSDKYFRKAILSLRDFKELISDSRSNFPMYKQLIIEEIKQIQSKIDNQYLSKELEKLYFFVLNL